MTYNSLILLINVCVCVCVLNGRVLLQCIDLL